MARFTIGGHLMEGVSVSFDQVTPGGVYFYVAEDAFHLSQNLTVCLKGILGVASHRTKASAVFWFGEVLVTGIFEREGDQFTQTEWHKKLDDRKDQVIIANPVHRDRRDIFKVVSVDGVRV